MVAGQVLITRESKNRLPVVKEEALRAFYADQTLRACSKYGVYDMIISAIKEEALHVYYIAKIANSMIPNHDELFWLHLVVVCLKV